MAGDSPDARRIRVYGSRHVDIHESRTGLRPQRRTDGRSGEKTAEDTDRHSRDYDAGSGAARGIPARRPGRHRNTDKHIRRRTRDAAGIHTDQI